MNRGVGLLVGAGLVLLEVLRHDRQFDDRFPLRVDFPTISRRLRCLTTRRIHLSV